MDDRTAVTWLASYPKSGNTWLRFLLYSYYYGSVTVSAQVAERIPDIHALEADALQERLNGLRVN